MGKGGEGSFHFPCFNENNYQKEQYVLSNRSGGCYTVYHSEGRCKIQEKSSRKFKQQEEIHYDN